MHRYPLHFSFERHKLQLSTTFYSQVMKKSTKISYNGYGRTNEPLSIFMMTLSNFIESTCALFCSILYKMKYFLFKPINHYTFYTMKSKDVQDIVFSKYRDGDTLTKIFRDLSDEVGLAIIKRCCQMICQFGSIKLPSRSGRPRIVRTNENIRKVNNRLGRKERVST